MRTSAESARTRRSMRRAWAPVIAVFLTLFCATSAHAAQNYNATIPFNSSSPEASHYGEVTFWQAVKTRFTGDVTLEDTACDGYGVQGYFTVYPVTGSTGFTRTFYWGGGCGAGNGTHNDWPNEYFDRPSNIGSVLGVVCFIDNGAVLSCQRSVNVNDNPYT